MWTGMASNYVCTCGASGDHDHHIYVTGTTTTHIPVSRTSTNGYYKYRSMGVSYVSRSTLRQRAAQLRKPRWRKHRPDERPWEPKRVLREAVASWAVSVRQFAGR